MKPWQLNTAFKFELNLRVVRDFWLARFFCNAAYEHAVLVRADTSCTLACSVLRDSQETQSRVTQAHLSSRFEKVHAEKFCVRCIKGMSRSTGS